MTECGLSVKLARPFGFDLEFAGLLRVLLLLLLLPLLPLHCKASRGAQARRCSGRTNVVLSIRRTTIGTRIPAVHALLLLSPLRRGR